MTRYFLAGLIAPLAFAPFAIKHSGLLINMSASVPVGLYRQVGGPAKYIVFCLSSDTLNAALKAGLEIARGDCPGGVAPVLKPILRPSPARPLVYSSQGFEFDGDVIQNTAPKARSRNGSALAHFAFGKYTEGAWAVSGYSRDSFDSRYFGPVAENAIRSGAEPVLTW